MLSKKIWLGLLGIVVLVAAVCGALMSNRISSLKSQVDSLQETVSTLEAERDSLQNNVSALIAQIVNLSNQLAYLDALLHNSTTTNNTITLKMSITFKLEESRVIVTVNDDDYNSRDWLAVFSNGSWLIYANNWTIPEVMLCADGSVVDPTYHTPILWLNHFSCTFEGGIGYTFKIRYYTINPSWLFIFFDADSGNRISFLYIRG